MSFETRGILEEWMVIEAVSKLQRQKRHANGATPHAIYVWILQHYGNADAKKVTDLCFSMRDSSLHYSYVGGGGAPVYHHFRIHPDYYPEKNLDPYTEEEREQLRDWIKAKEALKASREERRRNLTQIKREELRELQRAAVSRNAARHRIVRHPRGWEYIDAKAARDAIQDGARALIFDTETTGLDPSTCDVIELSIIDGNGKKVFSERFNSWSREWPEASAINGIYPVNVVDCPHIEDRALRISQIFEDAEIIIGYNVQFDVAMLHAAGVRFPDDIRVCDVMEEFAQFYGVWRDYSYSWEWQSLVTAAKYYKIPTDGAHGSLVDCTMTRGVLFNLAKEPARERHRQPPTE